MVALMHYLRKRGLSPEMVRFHPTVYMLSFPPDQVVQAQALLEPLSIEEGRYLSLVGDDGIWHLYECHWKGDKLFLRQVG